MESSSRVRRCNGKSFGNGIQRWMTPIKISPTDCTLVSIIARDEDTSVLMAGLIEMLFGNEVTGGSWKIRVDVELFLRKVNFRNFCLTVVWNYWCRNGGGNCFLAACFIIELKKRTVAVKMKTLLINIIRHIHEAEIIKETWIISRISRLHF